AVSEIVLEVISVGFEHVEGLILDLPSRPTAGGEFGDALGGHRKISDEAVVVGSLSGVVADLDGEPVYRQGIFGSTQRYCRQPAIDRRGALATFADGLTVFE